MSIFSTCSYLRIDNVVWSCDLSHVISVSNFLKLHDPVLLDDPTDLKANMQFEMKYCLNDKRTHAESARDQIDKITAQIIIQIIQFDRF